MTTEATTDDRQLVWDLPLRTFHWALVVAIAGSFVTHYGSEPLANAGLDPFAWHARFGYATLVLVAFRVLWGFVGPARARFADFVRGPRAAWRYARGLFHGPAAGEPDAQAAGHNALGGWMVLVLLALVLAQSLTGLFANDQIMNAGPLVGYVETARSDALTTLHRQVSNAIAVAVLVHVAAAFWYLLARRENLIGAMLTGYKRGLPPGAAIGGQRVVLALVLAGGVSALLWWVIRNAPPGNVFGY